MVLLADLQSIIPLHSTNWVSHFSVRNLEAYSAYPILLHPTHYANEPGWTSDTEPPKEELDRIRKRHSEQEEETENWEKDSKEEMEDRGIIAHREKIREQAMERQIEAMRSKLKPKEDL